MSLEVKINNDLKEAMKAKDQVALRGIRAIKQGILLHKTSGAGDTLTEEHEIKLLQKLVTQRKDSISIFEKQGREDLAVVEREEVAIIERYLPKPLSADELETLLKSIIAALGATSKKDMGKVMAAANAKAAGRAAGSAISALVKTLLP